MAPDPQRALLTAANAAKNKDGDDKGSVAIYPTVPVGAVTVRGVPAGVDENGEPQAMLVEPERAAELLAFAPPAWTLNKDGSPMDEQSALEELRHAAAWSEPEAEEAPADLAQPTDDITEAAKAAAADSDGGPDA